MNKLLFLGFVLCSTFARSQAVIEHVYTHQTCQYNLLSPVWNLTSYGWVYAMKPYGSVDQISIYNSNHALIKTIQLQMPAGTTYVTISNISDKLFNNDNKIEVLYGYMTYTTPIVIKMVLQNEDGQVLQEFPGILSGYMYQINGDFKMLAGSSTDSNTYVYNLPGTVLDLPEIKNESSFYVSVFPNPCTSILNIESPPKRG